MYYRNMTLVYLGLIRSEISVNINEPLNCDMLNDTTTTPPPRHTLLQWRGKRTVSDPNNFSALMLWCRLNRHLIKQAVAERWTSVVLNDTSTKSTSDTNFAWHVHESLMTI